MPNEMSVAQLAKEFLTLYETQRFIIVVIRAR
jgi:hypothetical protein